MMLELVENQGDAWEYMKDAINRYYERVQLGQEDRTAPALRGTLTKPVEYDKVPGDHSEPDRGRSGRAGQSAGHPHRRDAYCPGGVSAGKGV